jgi:hypothetical protein
MGPAFCHATDCFVLRALVSPPFFARALVFFFLNKGDIGFKDYTDAREYWQKGAGVGCNTKGLIK